MTIDPMEEFWSPYLAMGNRPHMAVDPTGGCGTCPEGTSIGATHTWAGETFTYFGDGVWAADLGAATVTASAIPSSFSGGFLSDFTYGLANAYSHNVTLGLTPRNDPATNAYFYGQMLGDNIALVQGLLEMVGGGSAATGGTIVTIGSAGTASPLSVPVATGGALLAGHGSAVFGHSVRNVLYAKKPRNTTGKSLVDAESGKVVRPGGFMKKDGKYMELDPPSPYPKTNTTRGKPFSPEVKPVAKSKWAKLMELFGNIFDNPNH